MNCIKPLKLREGDWIGIVSPSSSIEKFPKRLKRGIENLEKMGLRVKLGKNCQKSFGQNAGTAKERAEDINDFFKDKRIKAIIATTGGWNSNTVLPLLDYPLIKKNPKIFCGFSDITAINLAIYAKTGLVTFNGPTVLPSFGEFNGLNPFSHKWFKKILFEPISAGKLDVPTKFTTEFLLWEKEDNRARKTENASDQIFLNNFFGEGRLVGGNLITLCVLGGTEYFPDFEGSILFLEEEGESTSTLERRMNYLDQLGVLKKIKGIIFGRPCGLETDSEDRTLEDILKEFGEKYKIPIVTNVDIGHTDPLITFPIGIKARIDSKEKTIEILESAVKDED